MTRPGIEPRSPGPLVNTLPTGPISISYRLGLFFHYFTLWEFFPTSLSWWFLAGVWATASLLKSPGLISVFWPILIMQLSWWFLLDFIFPSLPVSLSILWWPYQAHRLTIGITVTYMFHSFSVLKQGLEIYLSFSFSFNFTLWSSGTAKFTIRQVFFFSWLG